MSIQEDVPGAISTSSNSLGLSVGQAAKIALWVALSLILAMVLAVALAPPVMAAFGMTALVG